MRVYFRIVISEPEKEKLFQGFCVAENNWLFKVTINV